MTDLYAVIRSLALCMGAVAACVDLSAQSRIVAVGDVHGAYESFASVLQAAGVVGAGGEWSGGDAQLVVLGDVLDRSAESRRALQLVKTLQPQATNAGGSVELVLGNHEIMNLLGDLRYVTSDEFATYIADERPSDRDAAWQRFALINGDTQQARDQFAMRYPRGYFGHRAAFAPTGEFGAWLLARPVIVVVDGTAFVHGGLPATLENKTADEINVLYSGMLRAHLAAVTELEADGFVHVEDGLDAHVAAARKVLEPNAASTPVATRRAAEQVATVVRSSLLGGDSPFWYRGTATCSPAIEESHLERVLAGLGAERVVIGHTPTRGRALTRLGGRVVRADTGMLAAYGGAAAAIIVRGDAVRALYADSAGETDIGPEPRRVGPGLAGFDDDDELERLLATAPVLSRTPRDDGTELWRLDRAGEAVSAIFRSSQGRGFAVLPEVAAYRLDRMLALDLVPVTVRRESAGTVGSLRLDESRLPDERQRAADRSVEAACPLRDQFNAMYWFDTLAYNPGRRPEGMRYEPGEWSLVLTDNAALFGTSTDAPAYLREAPIAIGSATAARLRALDAAALERALADVLDEPRRTALLKRRDALLAR